MNISTRGLVAAIIAIGVAIAIITLAIGSAVHSGPVSTEEATLLATVMGAAIGAIATYLGLGRTAPPSEDETTQELPFPPTRKRNET